MIVRCPRCGTRYRLPRRSALGADATFECTRCEHVFAADEAVEGPEIDAPEPPEPVRARPPEPEDDEPDDEPEPHEARDDEPDDAVPEDDDFVFDDEPEPPPKPARTRKAEAKAPEPPRERKAPPPPRTRQPPPPDDDDDDADIDDDPSWVKRAAKKPKAEKAAKASKKDAEAAKAARPRSTLAFAVRCMLIVTLGYAVLSVYLYTHPDKLTDALAALPIVGPSLIETQLDPGEIELIDVHGGYRRVRDGALVFAITGQAVNNSPLPVDGVQILGRLVGGETRRQVVFCGTAPKDVEDLTMREISLLQTLAPPGDWRLEPGGQANFLVAFPEPADGLTEFTAEVVAVRRRRRAASAKDA